MNISGNQRANEMMVTAEAEMISWCRDVSDDTIAAMESNSQAHIIVEANPKRRRLPW